MRLLLQVQLSDNNDKHLKFPDDLMTYPFVYVHLKCAVVEREKVCVRAAGFIAYSALQPGK